MACRDIGKPFFIFYIIAQRLNSPRLEKANATTMYYSLFSSFAYKLLANANLRIFFEISKFNLRLD